MPKFNRQDIVSAHHALEIDYNVSGVLQERPSNQRRRMSSDVQIGRMKLREKSNWWEGYKGLTPNGKRIYRELEKRYGFKK